MGVEFSSGSGTPQDQERSGSSDSWCCCYCSRTVTVAAQSAGDCALTNAGVSARRFHRIEEERVPACGLAALGVRRRSGARGASGKDDETRSPAAVQAGKGHVARIRGKPVGSKRHGRILIRFLSLEVCSIVNDTDVIWLDYRQGI